jgi:hypothetical protein
MKNLHLIAPAVVTLLILISCKSPSNFEGGNPGVASLKMTDATGAAPVPLASTMNEERGYGEETNSFSDLTDISAVTRKIIKDGRMEIRVKGLDQGKKDVDSLVKKYKGYYADETFNNQDFSHGYSVKIRIPSAGFEAFIAEIESGVGEVAFKNITSRDVTEEFIDLETRLKNKKNYLNRYNELLKKAQSVKDILEIEEKTRLIEEEVESVQGRLKYLNNQVDFSTLELQISKKNDYNIYSSNKGKFIDRLKLSMVRGWFGLVTFALFLIKLWPFWIIVGILFYFIRKVFQKRKK